MDFILTADGDSLTAGGAIGGPSVTYVGDVPPFIVPNVGDITNLAVNGDTSSGPLARVPLAIATRVNGQKNIYSVFVGSNDLANATGQLTELETNYASTCIQMQAAQFRVIAFTLLPRCASFSGGQTAAGFEIDRQAFNTWLRTQTFYDGLCDVGNDPNYGQVGQCGGSNYIGDGVHLTVAAESNVSSVYYAPTILDLLAIPGGFAMSLFQRLSGFVTSTVTWLSSVQAQLSQPMPASAGSGRNFQIAPQPPNTTGNCGSLEIDVTAPLSGSVEAGIEIWRGETRAFKISGLPGVGLDFALWGSSGASTPSIDNFMIAADTTNNTYLNAVSTIFFQINHTTAGSLSTTWSFLLPITGAASTPLQVTDDTVTIAASGTTTLSGTQQGNNSLTAGVVSLTGAATLAFGNVGGAVGTSSAIYDLDLTNVTLGSFGLTLTNGSGSFVATTLLTTKKLLRVKCNTNAIAVG